MREQDDKEKRREEEQDEKDRIDERGRKSHCKSVIKRQDGER